MHTAVPGQEAGCNLFKNGEGGDSNFSCLPGSDGSNYPRSPSSNNSASSLFTQPVVSGTMPNCDRPNCMDHWNRRREEMRVRSSEVQPSVAADSETGFESISIAVGEVSTPPLADQPKLGRYYDQIISARVLSGRGIRRPKRVWCWPGKGTPSGARVKQTPPGPVENMVVGSREVSGPEPREKNCRVLGVPKLSSIGEEQCDLKPDPDQVGAVNASDKSPIVPNAETGSASSKDNKESGDNILSDPENVRNRIYASNSSTRHDSDSPVPVFPPERVCLVREERADYLSQFTRALGGEVLLHRWGHRAKVRLFGGRKA